MQGFLRPLRVCLRNHITDTETMETRSNWPRKLYLLFMPCSFKFSKFHFIFCSPQRIISDSEKQLINLESPESELKALLDTK